VNLFSSLINTRGESRIFCCYHNLYESYCYEKIKKITFWTKDFENFFLKKFSKSIEIS
jgi:hypothetical protein